MTRLFPSADEATAIIQKAATFGYTDCSRDMQNFLLRQLINLMAKS